MSRIKKNDRKKLLTSFLITVLFVSPLLSVFPVGTETAYAQIPGYEKVIFLTATGTNTWIVPDDWSNNNRIEILGAGGGGRAGSTAGAGGGGGGAYSATTVTGLTPGGSVTYRVGAGGAGGTTAGTSGTTGGDTFFNRTAGSANTCADTVSVCAKGGAGATTNTGGAGGAVASNKPVAVGFAGGAGGTGNTTGDTGGGGGGAAGPHGIGRTGGAGQAASPGAGGGGGANGTANGSAGSTNGGAGANNYRGTGSGAGANATTNTPAVAGTNGGGGGGGAATTTTTSLRAGANGGNGSLVWVSTHATDGVTPSVVATGPGGGGGGGGAATGAGTDSSGGNGGTYGAGGGGAYQNAGSGAQGIIVITYVPSTVAVKTIFLTSSPGSNQTWTVPDDWSDVNEIIVLGAGGGGRAGSTAGAKGGGGGAIATNTVTGLSPGGSVTYRVGAGGAGGTTAGTSGTNGGDTFFNRTAGTANTCADTVSVCAKGGTGGTSATAGGAGGSIVSNKPAYAGYNGGTGGSGNNTGDTGGGGGGAASIYGAGRAGGAGRAAAPGGGGGGGGAGGLGAAAATTFGGNGGVTIDGSGGGAGASATSNTAATAGTNGGGGGGGAATTTTTSLRAGADGSNSAIWTQTSDDATIGAGGGGGGGGATTADGTGSSGGNGGYGAGGGGAYQSAGGGGQGFIVIRYVPLPIPNPPFFTSAPSPASTSSITMTSTTTTSINTPIEYFFTATTSSCGADLGTGGTDSGWQESESYTNTGLQANKCYGYMVTSRDSLGNTGATSTASTTYTLSATPTAPTLASVTGTTLVLTNNENGNPTTNPTTNFTMYVDLTSPNDATWDGQYIDATGNPSATPVWLSDAQLTDLTVSGLSENTSYSFYAQARNQDSVLSGTSTVTATTTLDVTPPSPSPVSFTSAPSPTSTSSISMTTVTATDSNGPVEYFFTATTSSCGADVGTGGTDSGWQTNATYTNTGLQANKCYGYMVTSRDSLGNYGATSTASTTYTLSATPTAPTLASVGQTSLILTNNEGDNPTTNPATSFTIYVANTSPNDATWQGKYVDSGGSPNASPQWLTDAQLTSLTVTGLTGNTDYSFYSIPRNQDSVVGATSSAVATTTLSAGGVGTLTLGEHGDGQPSNKFIFLNGTDVSLFAFSLTPATENATTTNIQLDLSLLYNVTTDNITDIRLHRDYNSNGEYDAGETAVGGAGVFSATGATGTIVFSDDFLATTSQDYIVIADLSDVQYANRMAINLTTDGISATGVTSLQPTTLLGSVSEAEHVKGRAKIPGGIPSAGDNIGDTAPTGTVFRGGGGGGGGGRQSSVGDETVEDGGGETIGNETGFEAPTETGALHNQWTNGSNAYASDASYATSSTATQRQSYSTFTFGIQGGNQITGISVKLEARGSTGAGSIDLELSWNNGGSWTAEVKSTPTLTSTDAVYELGGQGDTWGRSWIPSEFADGIFHVRLTSQPNSNQVQVDAIQVRVFNQASGGGGGGGDAI